jgi:hypothetical protein
MKQQHTYDPDLFAVLHAPDDPKVPPPWNDDHSSKWASLALTQVKFTKRMPLHGMQRLLLVLLAC